MYLRFFVASSCVLLFLFTTACHRHEVVENPEITVEAQLVASSKVKTPEDVRPYDEALVWQEYLVKRVIEGKLAAMKIRVALWSVAGAQPVPVNAKLGSVSRFKMVPFDSVKGLRDVSSSDDLEIAADEPPRFLDLSQPLSASQTPGPVRYDYRGNLSEKMRLYWKLRPQLRVVVMGNSYAIKGINTQGFFEDEKGNLPVDGGPYPAAVNLAPAGGNLKLQCLMLTEYVKPLPKIGWVIWTVSPFLFNEHREDENRYDEFTASPGWKYDQRNKAQLWPTPPAPALLTVKDLHPLTLNSMDFWVNGDRAQTVLPPNLDDQRKAILKECHATNFSWSDAVFAHFSETVRALSGRGIRVLALTPPVHPYVKEAAAADRHGTSHEGYEQMVTHLKQLATTVPGMSFRDINHDGRHDFGPDEFYDTDHLNGKGADRLTEKLRQWMETTMRTALPGH